MILLSIFVFLAGLFMAISPGSVWMISESWKSNDATEPSDAYLISTRIGGMIMASAGILCLIVFIVL